MSAPSSRVSRAARLAGELLVIVLGVLIALSADAWLETRQDRESETRYLLALLEDLGETSDQLAASNATRERIFGALVRLADQDLNAADPDSLSTWVYEGLFLLGSFEPQLTALRDIQSSDQLRLLTPAVRREIAEVDRATGDLARLEEDFTRSQQALMDPYLVQRTPLAAILTVADSLPLAPRTMAKADWDDLQSDELRNAIAFKLSLGRLTAGRRQILAEQLDQLTAEVRARLVELGQAPE